MLSRDRLRNRVLWQAITLTWLCLVLFSCSRSEEEQAKATTKKTELTVAVSRTPLSSPFYIAEKKGYFDEEGLNIKIVDIVGGHKCLKAVLAGEAEMGTTSEAPIMFNAFKRDDFIVAATFVTSYNDLKIMIRQDGTIQSAQDLQNKKVAVVPGSASQFFIDFFMLMNGVDAETVQLEKMGPDKMPQALHDKRVDAISVWEPFGFESLKLLGDQLRILPHDKVYRETFNLVMKRDFADKNFATIEKMLRSLKKAIAFIHANEKASQQMIAKELDKDEAFIQWIWPDYDFDLKLDQELLITLDDEAKWAIGKGLVERPTMPNFFKIIDMRPLKKVSPDKVSMIH